MYVRHYRNLCLSFFSVHISKNSCLCPFHRGSVLRQEHYRFFSRILICKATLFYFFLVVPSLLHVKEINHPVLLFLHTGNCISFFPGSCSFCNLIVTFFFQGTLKIQMLWRAWSKRLLELFLAYRWVCMQVACNVFCSFDLLDLVGSIIISFTSWF